jgi:hypothetical protein
MAPDLLEQLTHAAEHHGVVIPLFRAFRREDLTAADALTLTEMATRRRAGALQISGSAVDVCGWLKGAGIHHAIVKGPAIAVAYEDSDREFGDLDLLVSPKHIEAAINIIRSHGARILEEVSWPRPDGIGEVSLILEDGVDVDLHTELVVQPRERRDFRLSTEVLLERSTTARILGADLPVLDLEDNVVHVALHAMVSGGDRLVWLADLDALVRQKNLSWPILIGRAREARAGLVVGVMLDRAAAVLGSPIPPWALRSLQRRGVVWAYLLRTFERSRPTASNYGRSVRGQVLVRATRETSFMSLVTLARFLWTDVVLQVARDPRHPWRLRLRTWMSRA